MAITTATINRVGLGKMTLHFKLDDKQSETVTIWCSRYNKALEKSAQIFRLGVKPTHEYWNNKLLKE